MKPSVNESNQNLLKHKESDNMSRLKANLGMAKRINSNF